MRWFLFAILLACKGDPAPTPQGSGSVETPVASNVGVPQRPVLPDAAVPRPELPGQKPASDSKFEAETRDGDWAEDTENTIQQRFEKVRGGKLQAAECRQSQCKLTITGSEGDLAKTIADLEGARGLHGFAKNILLTAPIKKPDGTLELRAYAIFDR